MQADGNRAVVELFEHALAQAREGRLGYAMIAMAQAPNIIGTAAAGSKLLEPVAGEALVKLAEKFEANCLNAVRPDVDASLGADFVCYNVQRAPVGFDFISWLVDAEMTRVREGAAAPLKVAFWLGRDGGASYADRNAAAMNMLKNVWRPALAMIGAVEDERALRGRCKELYVLRDVVKAARAGETVPRLRPLMKDAEEILRGGLPPITITLREAAHWPHRNSNLKAWVRFARDLQAKGERVIFVRDTCRAHNPMAEFMTCPQASIRADYRMALYATAKANLFVSNGPHALALFGDRPWLQFLDLKEDGAAFAPDTPSFQREHVGLDPVPGGQFPWSSPRQRIVYAPDSYDNLAAAWQEIMA